MPRLIQSSKIVLRHFNLEGNAWEELTVDDFLKNAIPFNQRLKSDFSGFSGLEEKLFQAIWGGRKIYKEKSKRRTLGRVIRNLYYSYHQMSALTVSMDKTTYTRNGRRRENVDSYRDIVEIFKFLEDSGVVGRKRGNTLSGKASQYWISLNSPFEERFRLWQRRDLVKFKFENFESLIVLKDSEKRIIPNLGNNTFIKEQEGRLRDYNELIKETRLGLQLAELDGLALLPGPTDFIWQEQGRSILVMTPEGEPVYRTALPPSYMQSISNFFLETRHTYGKEQLRQLLRLLEQMLQPELSQLRRIFNNSSLNCGGRSYGSPVQNLPKKLRARLTINGSPVVEHDYSCFHPSMLYHLKGIDAPPNPYLFDDEEPLRKLAKTLLNAAINAAKDYKAIASVSRSLRDSDSHDVDVALRSSRFLRAEPSWSIYKIRRRSLKALYEELIAYHTPISDRLGTGDGIRLQRIDSDIASDIIWHFTQMSVPIIPIHDSFITAEAHSAELKAVMDEMYFKRFKKRIAIK